MQLPPDNTSVCRSTYDMSQAWQREALPGTFQSTGVWEGSCSGEAWRQRRHSDHEGMTLVLMTAHVTWSSASRPSYPLLFCGPVSRDPPLARSQASLTDLKSSFLITFIQWGCGGHMCTMVCRQRPEDNSQKLALPFHHEGPWEGLRSPHPSHPFF